MPANASQRSRRGSGVYAAVISASLLMVCCPSTSTAAAMDDDSMEALVRSVSASDMLATVQDLQDLGSRAFCLDEAKDAAGYVHGRFRELGFDVHYQNFSFAGYASSNIVAVLNGTDPAAGVLLFGAHYDSENSGATTLELAQQLPAPGADDDASGVAAVLELSEALRGLRPKQTMKFVAFGAEEGGFDGSGGTMGSSHFVEMERAAGTAYECAIVMDMIGYAGDPGNHGTLVTNSDDMPFVIAAEEAVDRWHLELDLVTVKAPQIAFSDHGPFWSAGYPAVLMIERLTDSYLPVNPYYHSAEDTVDKLSGRQIENVTRCVLAGALGVLDFPKQGPALTSVLGAIIIGAIIIAVVLVSLIRKRRKSDTT